MLGERPFWYVLVRVRRSEDLTRRDASKLVHDLGFRREGRLVRARVVGPDLLVLGALDSTSSEDLRNFCIELDATLPGDKTFAVEQWICSYGYPLPRFLADDFAG
jgi:hypothetical protein